MMPYFYWPNCKPIALSNNYKEHGMQQNEHDKRTLLVIDDIADNLMLMNEILRDNYKVKGANSGERGLRIAFSDTPPDLILLDVMMPDMDGFEVCRRLKAMPQTEHIPIIFVTAKSDTVDEEKGLALGAVDYIVKPISPPIVKTRVKTHLALKDAADFLRSKNDYLKQEVERRTAEIIRQSQELHAMQDVTIMAMASLAETRDNETGGHIRRTQTYVKALAERLQSHAHFAALLTEENIDLLYKSAPLHDIGKVGIPDSILLKPGSLTAEEFELMKQHTTLGLDAIVQAENQCGMRVDFLQFAKQIAHSHHERWDGTGYPQGLAGDAIPLPARLMAIADVYDALINKRVYKPPFSHEEAVAIIAAGRGTQFDPEVLDAFIDIEGVFRSIAARFPA
jgi:putative two-component system response regulator